MSGEGKKHAAPEPMLTVEEAAGLAGFAPVTIARHIRAGRLVAIRLAHQYRIRLSDWEAFLESHRVTGRPVPVPAKKKAAAGEGAKPARIA